MDICSAQPSQNFDPSLAADDHYDRTFTTFHFGNDDRSQPGLSQLQAERFKVDFCRELNALREWSVQQQWLPMPDADLKVFVSTAFKISKSLVPAWFGEGGRMEFPTWRVAAGKAAVLHELVHVFWPNANRLLAEGLAVYLQAAIGGNPAFPNFGRPLHEVARERLAEMLPAFTRGVPASLAPLHLGGLDAIATPSPLTLDIGRDHYGEDAHGQACIYPIAGSFSEFLIATRGLARFRALYSSTPLRPMQRDAGSPQRWIEIYELSLADLAAEWKSFISGPIGR
jgi:hypothetical protein